MRNTLWMICVFFGLIFIPPVLIIMMALALTAVPMYYAVAWWLPIAVVGTLLMTRWYHLQSLKNTPC